MILILHAYFTGFCEYLLPSWHCCKRWSSNARKAAHFIQICSQCKIPLLFLVNVTGYMALGRRKGSLITEDGAKMVRAVAYAVLELTVTLSTPRDL